MKLFVWYGFETDYSSGVAVVLATSALEAKKMLVEEFISSHGYFPLKKGDYDRLESVEDYETLEDPEEIELDIKRVVVELTGGG